MEDALLSMRLGYYHMAVIFDMTKIELWDMQPGETAKSYAAFCAYRDLGSDRSLMKTVPVLFPDLGSTKPVTKQHRLQEWSAKHKWVSRCEAYDAYLDQRERKENEKAIRDMAKRHAKESMMLQQKAINRIKLIGIEDVNELTPKEALDYLKEAVRIERLSRGVPESIVEHGGISKIVITRSERHDEVDDED